MRESDTTPETSGVRIVTGAWLDEEVFEPMRWVVFGLIPEGLTILVGAPKLGKSWLVLSLAMAVAGGDKALGAIDTGKGRPVLYLALEDGHRRLQGRARQLLGEGVPIPADLHLIIEGRQAELREAIIKWLGEHMEEQPLVIVDTLAKLRPAASKADSAYDADYRFVGDMKKIIDAVPGGAMVMVHHTRKSSDGDFLDAVSGTQGIAGAADSTITLRRARQEKGATLSVTGRDVIEAEYAITSENGNWTLDGDDLAQAASAATERRSTVNLGDTSAEVVKFVNSRTETRPADLAAHLGIDSKTAGTRLGQAEKSGRISKTGRGVYTPFETFESVESEGVDTPYSKLSMVSIPPCVVCGKPVTVGQGDRHLSCSMPVDETGLEAAS